MKDSKFRYPFLHLAISNLRNDHTKEINIDSEFDFPK